MKYPRFTKFYQVNGNLDIECLTLTAQNGRECILLNGEGKDVKLSIATVDKMNMSRVIVLTDLEEVLRRKLERIQAALREHKVKVNPIDTVSVVYIRGGIRSVHQYDYSTGRYIQTFSSVSEAMESLGQNKKLGHRLSKACKGNRRYYSYKGFRWSYEKVQKLADKF